MDKFLEMVPIQHELVRDNLRKQEMKVLHLSTVHPRYDTRIYYKQSRTLSRAGYSVTIIVADGKGDECIDGVSIVDIGRPKSRLSRITQYSKKIFTKALKINADVYHLHDPELIPVGTKLKQMGKKVIFDAHEDYPKQILSKQYLGHLSKQILSFAFGKYEALTIKRFDAVVAATPQIKQKYLSFGAKCFEVRNYPIIRDYNLEVANLDKKKELCYIGGLSKERGIYEMISSAKYIDDGYRINLCGQFFDKLFEQRCMTASNWSRINFYGYIHRREVFSILKRSMLGLVTLHPTPNYLESLPIKLFEYMLAGLPVVASDFPAWREIIYKNSCGVCVDPFNPADIAREINRIIRNPSWAFEMGENGRRAVIKSYNWEMEEKKLLALYKSVLNLPSEAGE